jgi:hypothetical protein
MPNKYAGRAQIDSEHCRAICDEIGYHLHLVLGQAVQEPPAYLLRLLSRLEDQEVRMPSIVPSSEDMQTHPTANVPQSAATCITAACSGAFSATVSGE